MSLDEIMDNLDKLVSETENRPRKGRKRNKMPKQNCSCSPSPIFTLSPPIFFMSKNTCCPPASAFERALCCPPTLACGKAYCCSRQAFEKDKKHTVADFPCCSIPVPPRPCCCPTFPCCCSDSLEPCCPPHPCCPPKSCCPPSPCCPPKGISIHGVEICCCKPNVLKHAHKADHKNCESDKHHQQQATMNGKQPCRL